MRENIEREEGHSRKLAILRVAEIEHGLVVDSEVLRLFLVGWDVPASCAQLPVPSGVR
jgi:hypothetical protein